MKLKFKLLPFISLVLLAVWSVASFSGCAVTQTPLTGTYMDRPLEITSERNFDEVWSNVIDLFATNGLSIKIIDKTSGLIISERTSFIDNYTIEIKNETTTILENQNAFAVVSQFKDDWGENRKPEEITGEWNIRIKPIASGGTSINVNLLNLSAYTTAHTGMSTIPIKYDLQVKSTGRFEQSIAELVK